MTLDKWIAACLTGKLQSLQRTAAVYDDPGGLQSRDTPMCPIPSVDVEQGLIEMKRVSFRNRNIDVVPALLIQLLQVIVGGRRGTTGQYEAGERLFDLSPAADKDFFVVEGAGHYEMYYKPEYISQAIERLVAFYTKHLAA